MRYLNVGCGNHYHSDWVNLDFHSDSEDVIAHDLRKGIPFEDETFEVVYHSHVLEHFPRSKAKAFINECFRVLRSRGIIRVVIPDLEQIAREYLKTLEAAIDGSEEAAYNYDWILLEMYDQAVRHYSGGDMAAYLANCYLPNENYILQRIGHEGETLIKNLRGQSLNADPELNNLAGSDEVALAIGRFRLGGEVHQWMYDRYSLSRLLKDCKFENVNVCQAEESQIPNFYRYYLDVMENGQTRKPDSLFVEATKPSPVSQSWLFSTAGDQDILKIVQITTNDIQGGAARAAYRLHQGLRLLGQESLVLTRYRKSDDQFVCALEDLDPSCQALLFEHGFWAEIQPNYIDVNRTELSNTLFSFPYPTIDLSLYDQIKQADILNLHWVAWFQSAETIASLLDLGKPVVWTLHDMAAFTGGCHYSAGCQKYQSDCINCPQLKDDNYSLPEIVLENKIQNLSSYSNLIIVTPSHWLADCARRSRLFRNHRVEVIPHGLDTNAFKVIPKATAKEYLNISARDIVFLFGADSNQEKRKGANLLVQALRKCFQSSLAQEILQEGRIRILNFGHGIAGLDDLGVPVDCLGYVDSDEQLSYIYSAANVLLLPSLEDNLPNLMLEAMSCGTSVIAFKTGGMIDLIDDKKTGRLVSCEDLEGLSDAILDCLLDPDKYQKMGFEARTKIEQGYTLKHQANRYLDLYSDLLDLQERTEHIPKETTSCETPMLIDHPTIREVSIEAGCTALLKERQHIHDFNRNLEYTQAQLEHAQVQLEHAQVQLQRTQATIVAMESSKFWKIRKALVKAKSFLGFGHS